jgi:hypothetical protein
MMEDENIAAADAILKAPFSRWFWKISLTVEPVDERAAFLKRNGISCPTEIGLADTIAIDNAIRGDK